jgi:hypothetical protein
MNGPPDGFVGRKVQAVWVGWMAAGFLRPSAPLRVRTGSSTAPLRGSAQDDKYWVEPGFLGLRVAGEWLRFPAHRTILLCDENATRGLLRKWQTGS